MVLSSYLIRYKLLQLLPYLKFKFLCCLYAGVCLSISTYYWCTDVRLHKQNWTTGYVTYSSVTLWGTADIDRVCGDTGALEGSSVTESYGRIIWYSCSGKNEKKIQTATF